MGENKPVSEPKARCTVCGGTRVCSFCNGDGYSVEHERLTPCGVCETTGICPVCRSNE